MGALENLNKSNKLLKLLLSEEAVEKGTGSVKHAVIEMIIEQINMNDFSLLTSGCKKHSGTESECNKHDVSVPLPERVYDIDFDGHCKAGVIVDNGVIKIIGAMNGWGNSIDTDNIKIIERQ